MHNAGAIVIGGHFQGLGVVRALAAQRVSICLLDEGLNIGRFSKCRKKFIRCPSVRKEEEFLDFLTNLSGREGLSGWVIYPNDDETVRFLSRHKDSLEEHFRIPTPPWDVVKLAYDKKLTAELATGAGIPTPRTLSVRSLDNLNDLTMTFPVIIKPSVKEPFYSRTRKKAIRVDSRQELLREFEKACSIVDISQLMIQELIPGGPSRLFSVGSFYKEGEFIAKVVARRPRQHPMDFGHATTFAETVNIPILEEMTDRLLRRMGYYGLSEVEFMLDPRDGTYKLLEVNARLWGWHTLALGAGMNLPYLLFRDALGEEVHHSGPMQSAKWIRLTTDIPTSVIEIIKGRMTVAEYFRSLKGKKVFAEFSLADPLPFLAELLMIPYLWKKRGY